jgi:hypothetical protein
LQTFVSLTEIKNTFRVVLPRPYEWRLLQELMYGEINGLPESRGVAIATNGIIVAIVQESHLFFGHLDYFVQDEDEETQGGVGRKPSGAKGRRDVLCDFSDV